MPVHLLSACRKKIPLLIEGVDKKGRLGGLTTPQVSPQVNPQVGRLVAAVQGEMTREAIQEAIGIKDRKDFRMRYLHPALAAGLLEMTIPDRPSSRLQKFGSAEGTFFSYLRNFCP